MAFELLDWDTLKLTVSFRSEDRKV